MPASCFASSACDGPHAPAPRGARGARCSERIGGEGQRARAGASWPAGGAGVMVPTGTGRNGVTGPDLWVACDAARVTGAAPAGGGDADSELAPRAALDIRGLPSPLATHAAVSPASTPSAPGESKQGVVLSGRAAAGASAPKSAKSSAAGVGGDGVVGWACGMAASSSADGVAGCGTVGDCCSSASAGRWCGGDDWVSSKRGATSGESRRCAWLGAAPVSETPPSNEPPLMVMAAEGAAGAAVWKSRRGRSCCGVKTSGCTCTQDAHREYACHACAGTSAGQR